MQAVIWSAIRKKEESDIMVKRIKKGFIIGICGGILMGIINVNAAEYNPSIRWSGNKCTVTTRACSHDVLGYYPTAIVNAYNSSNSYLGTSGIVTVQYTTSTDSAVATVNKSGTYYTKASFYISEDSNGVSKRPGGIYDIQYYKP